MYGIHNQINLEGAYATLRVHCYSMELLKYYSVFELTIPL